MPPIFPSLAVPPATQEGSPLNPLILVVDDEPALRAMVARTLEADGFGVVLASDGLEAWGLLEEGNGPFALLLVDLVMPRWDGTTLIRRVRAEQPAQRVLLITGRREPELLEGVSPSIPVLLKPFAPTDLLRAVHSALTPRSHSAQAPP